MTAAPTPTPWEIVHAVDVLRLAGAVVVLGPSGRSVRMFSRREVADMLSVHVDWVRDHDREFPGRVKIPGGDVRIPLQDVEHALERWRADERAARSAAGIPPGVLAAAA